MILCDSFEIHLPICNLGHLVYVYILTVLYFSFYNSFFLTMYVRCRKYENLELECPVIVAIIWLQSLFSQ